jgi:hypothetical protein
MGLGLGFENKVFRDLNDFAQNGGGEMGQALVGRFGGVQDGGDPKASVVEPASIRVTGGARSANSAL